MAKTNTTAAVESGLASGSRMRSTICSGVGVDWTTCTGRGARLEPVGRAAAGAVPVPPFDSSKWLMIEERWSTA